MIGSQTVLTLICAAALAATGCARTVDGAISSGQPVAGAVNNLLGHVVARIPQ